MLGEDVVGVGRKSRLLVVRLLLCLSLGALVVGLRLLALLRVRLVLGLGRLAALLGGGHVVWLLGNQSVMGSLLGVRLRWVCKKRVELPHVVVAFERAKWWSRRVLTVKVCLVKEVKVYKDISNSTTIQHTTINIP